MIPSYFRFSAAICLALWAFDSVAQAQDAGVYSAWANAGALAGGALGAKRAALSRAKHSCGDTRQVEIVTERLTPMGGGGGRADITFRCVAPQAGQPDSKDPPTGNGDKAD